MIIFFLSNLSAQTPAKGDIRKVGRKPAMIAMVIMTPLCVSSVIYQEITHCASEEPNKEIIWLVKNKIILFFWVLFIK
jgi:hypothetical protein